MSRRQKDRPVKIRVTQRGADYVEGLEVGKVYTAHIKPRWPETVWPERTGLSHTCLLLKGMYELVGPDTPVDVDREYVAPYRVETRMGADPDGAWGNVGVALDLEDAKRAADWFVGYHAGGRIIDQTTGEPVYTGHPEG